ncbi:MAG: hypothetical protein JXB85_07135 [Anaerolineales bacterium]|nr:hypothetical protein [Anaerolineales bacterium]
MTNPTSRPGPVEQLASEISSLQSKLASLQNDVRMSDARDSVEDLQTKVNGMAQRIASLRERGYVFEKELKDQAADFVRQWQKLYPSIQQQINTQATSLQNAIRPLEVQMSQIASLKSNPARAKPLLVSLKTNVETLESKAEAAQRTISGMYDQFNNQVYRVSRRLDEIERMLKNLSEASFQLLPTEGGIAAVKAVWCKTGEEQKTDPEGILFLTDQRLLFERKEKVATKKMLFIATEKETVQELQWEAPVTQVEKIVTSKKGLLKNEDHLEIRFAPGTGREIVNVHIWALCDEWQALIQRAKAKEFDPTRAVAIDQAEVDKVKSVPSQCPACGGALDQVILRGQDVVKCKFCGNVIRL